MLLGTGDGDIEQPALFFQRTGRISRHAARKQVFFQPHHEDILELQSLGGMNRHQRHFLPLIRFVRVQVGEQRHFRQEIDQGDIRVALFLPQGAKVIHPVRQLLNVFLTAQVLGRRVLIQLVHDARPSNDIRSCLVSVLLGLIGDKALYQLAEALQLGMRAFVNLEPVCQRLAHNLPKAHPMSRGGQYDFSHGSLADSARRVVDHPLKRLLIVRVHHQTEVSYHILYLFALIERESPVNLIRYASLPQRLFKDTALGIRAIQYGIIAVSVRIFAAQAGYFVHHDLPFFHIAVCLKHAYGFSLVFFGEYGFRYPPLVLLDQAVGSAHDHLRGTIVLLQLKDFGFGIYLREIKNIIDVRATERVDALGIVAHNANPAVRFGKLQHDGMLGVIRVLILVYQDITELLAIACQHLRKVAEQHVCVHQQVVEIHSPRLSATLPVHPVYIAYCRNPRRPVRFVSLPVGGISRRKHQMILRVRYARLHKSGLVHLLIQPHLLDNRPQEAFGVGSVIDGKPRSEPDMLRLRTQDARKDGVERTHPQVARLFRTYPAGDTLFHLARGLVGESQREYIPRLISFLQQVSNLIRQHARFSRTGAGYHQRGTVVVSHRSVLAIIQFVSIFGIHAHCPKIVPTDPLRMGALPRRIRQDKNKLLLRE